MFRGAEIYLSFGMVLGCFRQVVALRSNCSLDAAVQYTDNDRIYLFKGSKYARWLWTEEKDELEYVAGREI